MKRKDVQKKKLTDVLCASNIKNPSEQHVLSKNVRTFLVNDHDEGAIYMPSINKQV